MNDAWKGRGAVMELAAAHTSGFRASYVAKWTGQPLDEVQRQLATLVTQGDLEIRYELLCPDNGRLVRRYVATDTLPLGKTISRDDCEEFEVTPQLLWVTYRPTADLAMALLKRVTPTEKAEARRSLLRRALGKLGIGSIRTPISSRTSTSMHRSPS